MPISSYGWCQNGANVKKPGSPVSRGVRGWGAYDITAIETAPSASAFDLRRLDRALEDHLGHFGEVLRGDVIKARQALQKLLVDRVRFTPITLPDGQRTYRLEAELTLERILTTEVNNKVYVPDGICTLLFPSVRVLTVVKRAA